MKCLIALLLVFAGAGWAETPAAWTPELSMQVQSVGNVVPSPDGRLVVWTQTRAVMETEKSEMVTQIFLADAGASRRIQLTSHEKGASSPSFSPDSRYVYFLSDRSGKRNVWRIPVDGGEGEMLTDWKGALGTYDVSPDGKWVAFTGRLPDDGDEKAKKEKRDFRVVDQDPKNHGLWVIPAEAGPGGKREARKVFDARYHITGFDWAPDSRNIAFAYQTAPEADFWTSADVSEVEVESGKVRAVAATPAAEGNPAYSPDGRYIAYTTTSNPPRWAGDARTGVRLRRAS